MCGLEKEALTPEKSGWSLVTVAADCTVMTTKVVIYLFII
jgi:hypothetical protein